MVIHDHSSIRSVLARIDAAWRRKQFSSLTDCFHPDAVIVGPGNAVFAQGREACAESYKEFATNASVLNYDERNHELRVWETTAVYTFAWSMTYQREHGPQTEAGTDEIVLTREEDQWMVVFRYIFFAPSDSTP